MKPFVVNRYGRIVFPFNFFPALDFSVFETLEQFAAVIRRDFEEKAPTEADIVARLDAGGYKGRYELLRDLALDLFWVNRYPFTMYDKQPMRWRDVPRQRDDIFLPIFKAWEGAEPTAAIETGYRSLVPTWDEGTENKIFRILLDVFRHKKGAGAELSPIKPTVGEILSNSRQPHLSPARPRPRLSRLRLGRHRRVLAPGARAGGADAPDDDPAQPVPLGPGQDARDRGRQAPRRRLRGGVPAAQRRRAAVHPAREGRPPRPARPARARPTSRAPVEPYPPVDVRARFDGACRGWRRWPSTRARRRAPTTT